MLYEGIMLYCFEVQERGKGPTRFLPTVTHYFAATDIETAKKWFLLIEEHYIAYKNWNSISKVDKTIPKSPAQLRKPKSYFL